MANYNANINITVAGASRLNAVTTSVERLNSLVSSIKPINLLSPGAGKLGDDIKQALKPINDFARGIENGNKLISNTFAGAIQQANLFRTVLENVKVVAGGFGAQAAEVKLYANALAAAEDQATRLSKAQNDLMRTTRGLQPQDVRDFEVARRLRVRQSLRFRRAQGAAGTENLAQATESMQQAETQLNNIRLTREQKLFQLKLNNLEDLYAQELRLQKRNDAEALADFDRRLNARTRTRQGGTGFAGTLRSGRLSGILENAVIGGAFPLLFGQGAGAATGGAIGGLVGGAFGGAGGFAGSLLGTLIGDLTQQSNQIKELGADIGFSAEQTKQLQEAFKLAGKDAEKFTEAVQNIRGLGLELADQAAAIRLFSTLSKDYGANITKTTNAFTSAVESGRVTQATLNQLTSQGINIQDALSKKYDVSRDKILQMAKDGEISVQALADTLVDLANSGEASSGKVKSSFQTALDAISGEFDKVTPRISEAFGQIQTAGTNAFTEVIKALTPLVTALAQTSAAALEAGASLISAFAGIPNYVQSVSNAVLSFIPGLNILAGTLRFMRTVQGPKAEKFGPYVPERLQRVPIPRIQVPSQLPPSGAGAGKAKRDRSAEAAAREAARVEKVVRERAAETEFLAIQAQLQERIFQAEQNKDSLLVARLRNQESVLDIQFKYAQELANEFKVRAQQAIVKKGLQETENARLKLAQTLKQLEAERTSKFSEIIADLDFELRLKQATTDEAAKQLQIEEDMRKLRKEGFTEDQLAQIRQRKQLLAVEDSPGQKRMKELQKSISDLTNIENVAVSSADMMGMAFTQAFQEIITGSANAEQALADMLKSIGDNFINMATEIIAQQMAMILLGTILKALGIGGGGGGGGGGADFSGAFGGGGPTFNPGAFAAQGAYWPGGFQAFADGGLVTRPTMGLIGEGGEPEYVIPASKMRNAMNRYAAGARGSAVIPAGSEGEGGTATMAAPVGAIDVRYTVERINSVDYVTADQFQAGMQQAASQGAAQGERRALRTLQQSTSIRNRVGLR